MKYALVFAIIVAAYSFSQCYRFLAFDEEVSFLKSIYCNVTFFGFIPRPFSVVDFFVHLLIWIAISFVGYSFWSSYLRGRFP